VAGKQAFKTVFCVTSVGTDVTPFASVGKHIAFNECNGKFWAIVSTDFAQDNKWESVELTYQQGKLSGSFPGANRDVVFDYDEPGKRLICRMPSQGPNSMDAAMAKAGN
jgi:hypothetical protein